MKQIEIDFITFEIITDKLCKIYDDLYKNNCIKEADELAKQIDILNEYKNISS